MVSSSPSDSTTLQHPNTAANICRPLVDSVKMWESIAATEYAFDGVLDGWDSDSEAPAESAEDKYLQVQQLFTLIKGNRQYVLAAAPSNNMQCK